MQAVPTAPRRSPRRKGFTLVEVMVATTLLTMVGMGILSVFIGAYRVAAKARYRDHARYIIKSFADQFLTQQTSDSQTGVTFTMFVPTVDGGGNSVPLGTGLSWTNTDGTSGQLSSDSIGATYTVYIGDNTGTPIPATVTRWVRYVDPTTGFASLISNQTSAGSLLEGDFTISYPYLGSTVTQTIVAVRANP
jgi:prepilin-type N-terminal cleavage/methylation domain-containing protein